MHAPEMILTAIQKLGAAGTGCTPVSSLVFDRGFRDLCRSNACGNYGINYTCPPHCGEIDDMIRNIQTYNLILLYQTVWPLEDSYDYEGMMEAGKNHAVMAEKVTDLLLKQEPQQAFLHLGAGGCRRCVPCYIGNGRPCPAPERALTSLEANGIDVSRLAASCGLPYINGVDAVTYFGAVLLRDEATAWQ